MTVRAITVDNRVCIPIASLSSAELARIESEFTYENPDYVKWKQLKLRTRPPPSRLITWNRVTNHLNRDGFPTGPCITVPRGGLERVKEIMGDSLIVVWNTTRCQVNNIAIPPHQVELWPFQEQMVQHAIQNEVCCLRAPPACLVGETMVGINRAGKGSLMRLDHVVHMFNGGVSSNRTWDRSIPTYVRAPTSRGTVGLHLIRDASASGVRRTFRVWLEGGFQVCGTSDHRMLTPFGWVEIGDLSRGDFLLVEESRRPSSGVHAQRARRSTKSVPGHPYASIRSQAHNVLVARLVAEARLNGMPFDEFVEAVRARVPTLTFLDPKVYAVHHDDRDPTNNSPDNLIVLTHEEHSRVHREDSIGHIEVKLSPRKVIRVERATLAKTFDLEVEGSSAFMANGVAVHNSGKTTAALALAARLNLYTLVIVWTGALLKQWVERCGSELGLYGDAIGIIQGDDRRVRPITIGMQQTLGNCIEEFAPMFGVVICDELQRFASETFNAVIDKCPAKYRIGVSADERRADGKEFLIYDMFGEVAFEVERQELEDAGRIIDVEVRVVPTDFDRSWYRDLVKRARFGSKQRLMLAFNRLLQEMTEDPERNALIGKIAAEHVAAGQLVVALSHRREHCGVISAEFDRVTGGKGGILLGGKGNEDEYARAKDGLKSGRVRAAAATFQAFGTGMDIPGLEVGIFATPVGNSKKAKMQFDQYRGRFARAAAGKSSACVYYLWDRALYGQKPLKNLASWCKNVVVRHDERWVPVREFMKERNAQTKRDSSSTAEASGLFFDPRTGGSAGPGGSAPRKLRSRSDIRH